MALFEFRAAVLLVVVAWCVMGPALGAPPADSCKTSGFTEPLDLSHPVGPLLTQNWPGSTPFTFTKMVATEETDYGGFLSYNEFCMAEHSGTHLDAPYHFAKTGWKVADIPLRNLMAPGVLLDASEAAAADSDTTLGAAALDAWERQHGRVPRGSVVLVRFGWADKYPDRKAYFGTNTDDRNSTDTQHLSFPGVSGELARALVERGVVGVGLDTPSVDAGKAGDHAPVAHRTFCGANVYILENVNLKTTALPPKGFTVIVMPTNIVEGTGAPARVIAIPGNIEFWKS